MRAAALEVFAETGWLRSQSASDSARNRASVYKRGRRRELRGTWCEAATEGSGRFEERYDSSSVLPADE